MDELKFYKLVRLNDGRQGYILQPSLSDEELKGVAWLKLADMERRQIKRAGGKIIDFKDDEEPAEAAP